MNDFFRSLLMVTGQMSPYLPLCSCGVIPGVESAKASATRKTLIIKGAAAVEAIRTAVEKAGYTFKGKKA